MSHPGAPGRPRKLSPLFDSALEKSAAVVTSRRLGLRNASGGVGSRNAKLSVLLDRGACSDMPIIHIYINV